MKLLERGYDSVEIDDGITDALSIDRTELLQQNKSKGKEHSCLIGNHTTSSFLYIPLVLITKYNQLIYLK